MMCHCRSLSRAAELFVLIQSSLTFLKFLLFELAGAPAQETHPAGRITRSANQNHRDALEKSQFRGYRRIGEPLTTRYAAAGRGEAYRRVSSCHNRRFP